MKKLFYFLPSILFGLILLLPLIEGEIPIISIVTILEVLFLLAGLFFTNKRWYGCIFGIFSGIILVYMGLQETGQIVKEYVLGFPLIVYYLVVGYLVWKTE